MKKYLILILDHDKEWLNYLTELVHDEYDCALSSEFSQIASKVQQYNPKVVILGQAQVQMPDLLQTVEQIQQLDSHLPIIVSSDSFCVEQVVSIIKAGVFDIIPRQPKRHELKKSLLMALNQRRLQVFKQSVHDDSRKDFANMIGRS